MGGPILVTISHLWRLSQMFITVLLLCCTSLSLLLTPVSGLRLVTPLSSPSSAASAILVSRIQHLTLLLWLKYISLYNHDLLQSVLPFMLAQNFNQL